MAGNESSPPNEMKAKTTASESQGQALAEHAHDSTGISQLGSLTSESEPPSKRIKVEPKVENEALRTSTPVDTLAGQRATAAVEPGESHMESNKAHGSHTGASVVTASPLSSSSESLPKPGAASLPKHSSAAGGSRLPALQPKPSKQVPLKSTTMGHLNAKYMSELEYMLREFRKLERQLLGARGANSQVEESSGAKERREKLHSFILHLEDTVRQIQVGCQLEAEGKSTLQNSASDKPGDGTGFSGPSSQKEEEENVQKLEEHILANLLPVKIRLKKQLAAQQGATRNPAGMPVRRGSLQPPAAAQGKGTFVEAAEQRRREAEAARRLAEERQEAVGAHPTHFDKPLAGGGSSLTQKLHGDTLGSKERKHGDGVGSAKPRVEGDTSKRAVIYAGMVPGSTQHQSSLMAASGVHDMVVEDPNLLPSASPADTPPTSEGIQASSHPQVLTQTGTVAVAARASPKVQAATIPEHKPKAESRPLASEAHKPLPPSHISEEERRKIRKKRRKRKLLKLAKRREKERHLYASSHQDVSHTGGAKSRKKGSSNKQGKKKGPKPVEYICALCSEVYGSTCDYNPWWALTRHPCPKCRKDQVPRIDISSPANAIEYHPALLAHADENGGGGGGVAASSSAAHTQPASPNPTVASPAAAPSQVYSDSDSDSDLSELSEGELSDALLDSDLSDSEYEAMTPADKAEHENFGAEYRGPCLTEEEASRLLILMCHASTCPCQHKLTKHKDVCKSLKYMMLHVRDCPGTTACFDVCPFPWCRKVKHLLYHLVSCSTPTECSICSPTNLSSSLQGLVALNSHRYKAIRNRLRTKKSIGGTKGTTSPKPSPSKKAGVKSKPVAKSAKSSKAKAKRPTARPAPQQKAKSPPVQAPSTTTGTQGASKSAATPVSAPLGDAASNNSGENAASLLSSNVGTVAAGSDALLTAAQAAQALVESPVIDGASSLSVPNPMSTVASLQDSSGITQKDSIAAVMHSVFGENAEGLSVEGAISSVGNLEAADLMPKESPTRDSAGFGASEGMLSFEAPPMTSDTAAYAKTDDGKVTNDQAIGHDLSSSHDSVGIKIESVNSPRGADASAHAQAQIFDFQSESTQQTLQPKEDGTSNPVGQVAEVGRSISLDQSGGTRPKDEELATRDQSVSTPPGMTATNAGSEVPIKQEDQMEVSSSEMTQALANPPPALDHDHGSPPSAVDTAVEPVEVA